MQAGWEFEPYEPASEGASASAVGSAFASQGSQQTTKRQVHSNACQACRDRKSKCNNDRPICRSCIQFKTPTKCKYDPDNDLRRKAGLRREVEKLKAIISKYSIVLGALSTSNSTQAAEIIDIIKEKTDVNEILNDVRTKHIFQHKLLPVVLDFGFQNSAPMVTAPVIGQNGMALSIASVEPITMPVAGRNDRNSITVVEAAGIMAMPLKQGQSAPAKVAVSVSHYPAGKMNAAIEAEAPAHVIGRGDDGMSNLLSRPVVRLGLNHFLDQSNAAHLSQAVNGYVHPPYSTSSTIQYGSSEYSDQGGQATAAANCTPASASVMSNVVDPIKLSLSEQISYCMDGVPWNISTDLGATASNMPNTRNPNDYFNSDMNAFAWNPVGDANGMLLHPSTSYQSWDMSYRTELPEVGQTTLSQM